MVKFKREDLLQQIRQPNPYRQQKNDFDIPEVKVESIVSIFKMMAILYTAAIILMLVECLCVRLWKVFLKENLILKNDS